MNIYINNEKAKIDFDKNSESIRDLVEGIEKWARDKDLLLLGVVVDGKRYNQGEFDSLFGLNPKEINDINFEIESKRNIVVDMLNNVSNYIVGFLSQYRDDKFYDEIEPKLDVLEYIADALMLVKLYAGINIGGIWVNVEGKDRTIEDILNEIKHIAKELRGKRKETFKFLLESKIIPFITIIKNRFKEIVESSPGIYRMLYFEGLKADELKAEIIKQLEVQKELCEKIAEYIQVGKDKEAFDIIYSLTVVIESIFLSGEELFDKDTTNWDEIRKEFNKMFLDIFSAFKNNDFVSISDIIEYELPESIDKLISLIKS